MTQYFTYAKFISCTNLVEFQNSGPNYHKINFKISIPQTHQYLYDRIEIYRYVGEYMECGDKNKIINSIEKEKHAALVFKAIQQFDTNGYANKCVFETYSGNTFNCNQTINNNLTGIEDFTDNLNILSDKGNNLRDIHYLSKLAPGMADNFNVLNDIGFTRRVLFYVIKTYIKGNFDAAPYLLTPDWKQRRFVNHSTKTQVRHDYLHYEGDEIWLSDLSDKAGNDETYGGISRTSVDINRLYADSVNHAGPTGRGGHAWVSCRSTGKVFKHNLRDGALEQVFNTGICCGRGHGIGIDIDTGDCIATPSKIENNKKIYVKRCNIRTGKVDNIMEYTLHGAGIYGYGVIPIYGKPDRMLVTSYQGRANIVYYKNINSNGVLEPYNKQSSNDVNGYAACSGPNSKGLQASQTGETWNKIAVINTDNGSHFSITPNGGNITKHSSRINIDSHKDYPHTILHPLGNRDYYSIFSDNEYGYYIDKNATDNTKVKLNWAVKIGIGGGTPGCDGENNLWNVVNNNKTKIYRTAGNREINPDINDEYVYPHGGNSRYPNIPLKDWPIGMTNTPIIEWFLTRNHQVVTGTGLNGEPITIDEGTLDNTTVVSNWDPNRGSRGYPGNTTNQTASAAWWSLVDERMLRKHDINTYFKVYKISDIPSQRIIYPKSRKWGIRMNVTDIYDNLPDKSKYGNDVDNFYENGRDIWLPEISERIRAWSKAFAEPDSYPSATPQQRKTLVENNLLGIKVHPFYEKAQSLAGVNRYINDETFPLDSEKRKQITKYMDNLKMYNFKNRLCLWLYMYSDFTGGVLAGTIESIPINKDIIHPATTNPSLTLLMSAYQSNPTIIDKPEHCYPWKRTVPVSMSAMYEAITGYDDFNVTFLVSTYPGSYLINSYNIYTDDCKSTFEDDVRKQAKFNIVTNLAYNNNNDYTSKVYFRYTYLDPSVNGLFYLDNSVPRVENLLPIFYNERKLGGVFKPIAEISAKNLYECQIINPTATGNIMVLERWPQPKFYLNGEDNSTIRYQLFDPNNTWGWESRFNKTNDTYHESNSIDAKKYDILHGVDPLSADVQDRSIARTWNVSAWQFTVSTNNFRIPWYPETTYIKYAKDGLFLPQDLQSSYQQLLGSLWRYGDYKITLTLYPCALSCNPLPPPPPPEEKEPPKYELKNTHLYFFIDDSSTITLKNAINNALYNKVKTALISEGHYTSEEYDNFIHIVNCTTERTLNWASLYRWNYTTHGADHHDQSFVFPDFDNKEQYISFTFCEESLNNKGPAQYHDSAGNPLMGPDVIPGYVEWPTTNLYVGPIQNGMPAHFKYDMEYLRQHLYYYNVIKESPNYIRGAFLCFKYKTPSINAYSNFIKKIFGDDVDQSWSINNPNYSLSAYDAQFYRAYGLESGASQENIYNYIKNALDHFGITIPAYEEV